MNDLISIVVPIYNVEKYLEICLNSILKQTYTKIEIILIDDGATDSSGNICDEYAKKDNRIKVIHKKNGGLSDARNKGIEEAKGKYITFIDSDDYIDENYILFLYNSIIKNNVKIAQCNFIKVDENGKELKKVGVEKDCIISGKQMLEELTNTQNKWENIVVWNKMYDIILFNEIRFPKGKIHEDEFTTYKLLYDQERVSLINKFLYFYRQNSNSITGKKFNIKRLDYLNALEERMTFYKLKSEEKLYYLTLETYLQYIKYAYINLEDNKDVKRKLIKLYKEHFAKLKKCRNINLKQKVKQVFFTTFPDIYLKLKQK